VVARRVNGGTTRGMGFAPKSKLPRLPRAFYQRDAYVFWSHTMEARATGWLTREFHQKFREALLHACSRYGLVCPSYVLMPDHWHNLLIGCAPWSDQRSATAFLRRHISAHLLPAKLQDRPHDHVLFEHEREREAVESTFAHILENPVRKNLVATPSEWEFRGAIVPGYPDLDPLQSDFRDKFWSIRAKLCEANRL
jgi:putative transposase